MEIEERLGYRFKDKELLLKALRHPSYVNEKKEKIEDNERLEFLGDSVLCLAISHILMDMFPLSKEGKLSKLRAAIVSKRTLAQVARSLDLGNAIFLGKGEEAEGGREKDSILADTVEAIFGAMYLDAGFEKTFSVIKRLFSPFIIQKTRQMFDYKSHLQEITQKRFGILPEYKILSEEGPPHRRIFEVGLFINRRFITAAKGKSKKEAEQKAAKEAIRWIKDQEDL